MQSDPKLNFVGLPGHVGIPENEKAGRTAKHFIDDELYEIKIPFSVFKPCIPKYVNSFFQTTWNNCSANKLHQINATFLLSIKIYSDIRREVVILTRLRMGHTRLTLKHYLLGEDFPECIPCACHVMCLSFDYKTCAH